MGRRARAGGVFFVVVLIAACSKFGTGDSEGGGTSSSSSSGSTADASPANESGTDPGDGGNGTNCTTIAGLDFEGQVPPPAPFDYSMTEESTLDPLTGGGPTGRAMRATAKGTRGKTYITTDTTLPNTTRHVRLSFAFHLESYPFGTAPGAPYMEFGCGLTGKDGPDFIQLRLERSSAGLFYDASDNEPLPAMRLTAPDQQWHRILIDTTIQSGSVRSRVTLNDAEIGSIDFKGPKPSFRPRDLELLCGVLYTEDLAQPFIADVDNVKLEFCD